MSENKQTAVKKALCVSAAEACQKHPFFWNPYLVDRAIADNQEVINEENLQLLPYVSLARQGDVTLGESEKDTYLLAYDRGGKGAESRLHAMSSIGFGGHIDNVITTNLINLVAEEAMRELSEELGYIPETKLFYQSVTNSIVQTTFIHLPDTNVGKVHLGLFISIPFEAPNDLSTLTLEEGQILNVRWINASTITDDEISKFEPWSAFILSQNKQVENPESAETTQTSDTDAEVKGSVGEQLQTEADAESKEATDYTTTITLFTQDTPDVNHLTQDQVDLIKHSINTNPQNTRVVFINIDNDDFVIVPDAVFKYIANADDPVACSYITDGDEDVIYRVESGCLVEVLHKTKIEPNTTN